jgi:phosphate transport system permease protein
MISNTKKIKNKLAKRYAKEKRFQIYGLSAIAISIAFLLSLLINISTTGFPAFQQTYINTSSHQLHEKPLITRH